MDFLKEELQSALKPARGMTLSYKSVLSILAVVYQQNSKKLASYIQNSDLLQMAETYGLIEQSADGYLILPENHAILTRKDMEDRIRQLELSCAKKDEALASARGFVDSLSFGPYKEEERQRIFWIIHEAQIPGPPYTYIEKVLALKSERDNLKLELLDAQMGIK